MDDNSSPDMCPTNIAYNKPQILYTICIDMEGDFQIYGHKRLLWAPTVLKIEMIYVHQQSLVESNYHVGPQIQHMRLVI